MILYHSPTSPYVRKVMVTLHLTGQLDAVELVAGSGTPLDPNESTLSSNPLGKIPCLVVDGVAMFDSRVICRYLDARARGGKGAGLYPQGAAQFPAITAEALADGILDAGLLATYEWRLRPETVRFQPWVDSQVGKIDRGLQTLNRLDAVLKGPTTIAKVAAGCAAAYIDFRFPDLNWRDRCHKLADWYAEFAETPAMRATAIPT